MHTNSIPARVVTGLLERACDETPEPARRGDVESTATGMWVCCPGCGSTSLLQYGVSGGAPPAPQRWQLSGTPEKPTLKPSINHPGCWHGWLTDGQFTSC